MSDIRIPAEKGESKRDFEKRKSQLNVKLFLSVYGMQL